MALATRPLGPIHLIADFPVLAGLADADARIAALLDAGLPSLSVRRVPAEEGARARAWRAAAKAAGAFFVVNGPLELFHELEADGWHRPAAAPDPPADFPAPWGRAAHDRAELDRAAGAAWRFVSPVYPTASKPDAPTLGPRGLAALIEDAAGPVWALGGVTRDNWSACREAGAAGVAAIRGLLAPSGPDWVREVIG